MAINTSELGGGGGVPINGLTPLNVPNALYESPTRQVYLKTGYLETDTASYPDASLDIGAITDLSVAFSTAANVTNEAGVSFDPISKKFYVLDSSGYICSIYDEAGAYLGQTAALTSGPNTSVSQFTVYDDKIYILESKTFYRYNSAGVYEYTYSFLASTTGTTTRTMAYIPEEGAFIYSGNVNLYYANPETGVFGNLGTPSNLTGQTIGGVVVSFGKILCLTFNTSTSDTYLWSTNYAGTEDTFKDFIPTSVRLTDTTYGTHYGLTLTDGGLFTTSRDSSAVIKINVPIGVGSASKRYSTEKTATSSVSSIEVGTPLYVRIK